MTRSKLPLKKVGALIAVLAVAGFLLFLGLDRSAKDKSAILPEVNRQLQLSDGSRVYATGQDLQQLLIGLDIHFKARGLTSDANSQPFEFSDESDQTVESCVAFDYFSKGRLAVTLTLIPEDPACFTSDQPAADEISRLHADYRYVYAIELH